MDPRNYCINGHIRSRFLFMLVASIAIFIVYLLMQSWFGQTNTRLQYTPLDTAQASAKRDNFHDQTESRNILMNIDVHSNVAQHNKSKSIKGNYDNDVHIIRAYNTGNNMDTTIQRRKYAQTKKKRKGSLNPYSGPENSRQESVVSAMSHAWNAYRRFAWGHDELHPLSADWHDWFGIALTLVDSLDTLYIMGMHREFSEARQWVATNLTFDTSDHLVLTFEVVIRELGGLLSAYHLSNDRIFLDKALDLGNRMLPCLQSESGIPCEHLSLVTGTASYDGTNIASAGSLQLEFTALGKAVKDDRWQKRMLKLSQLLNSRQKTDGLLSNIIEVQAETSTANSPISMGGEADSYYEYLLKQWLQTGKKQHWLKDAFVESVAGMKRHLVGYSSPSHFMFVGARRNGLTRPLVAEMEHLTCFLPGSLALAYMAGIGTADFMEMASNLTRTCYEMYRRTATGLSPEKVYVNTRPDSIDDFSDKAQPQNMQRPETIESLYYMYKVTKNEMYRDWAWNIFQSFEKYTKVQNGYASLENVHDAKTGYINKMESFFLAETLKYLYLLFSDNPDLLPLDKFVFNTEAHPLPIYPAG